MPLLVGRVAIVTGRGRDIGRQHCFEAAGRGYGTMPAGLQAAKGLGLS